MYALPDLGGIKPVNIETAVTFPAPLWPSSDVIWPSYILKLILSTATFTPANRKKLRTFWSYDLNPAHPVHFRKLH